MQHLAFSEEAEMGEEPGLLKWQEELFGKGFLQETVCTNKSHPCAEHMPVIQHAEPSAFNTAPSS